MRLGNLLMIELQEAWYDLLEDEFSKDYFKSLMAFLHAEREIRKKTIYPKREEVLKALNVLPPDQVKVIIVGEDPYYGGQANGLAFSVNPKDKVPPSLVNIFKELGVSKPKNGNLEYWAAQGVLLLNSVLTVEAQNPGSHRNKGWEEFTDAVISKINKRHVNLVFMLWGKDAERKKEHISKSRHLILESSHPSSFSVNKGFFGCDHFNLTNSYLEKKNKSPIKWI